MTSTSVPAVTPTTSLDGEKVPGSAQSPAGFLARRPAFGLGLFLLGGLIFGILAVSVRTNGPLLAWDLPIDQALHVTPPMTPGLALMPCASAAPWGVRSRSSSPSCSMLYWLWKRHWHAISMLIIGVIGGNIWFEVLSNLFGRHRPIFPDPLENRCRALAFPAGIP